MKSILFSLFLVCAGFFGSYGESMNVPPEVKTAFAKAGMTVLREKRPGADFTLKTLKGETLTLRELKGKVVFLNFWTTWCPPCRAEMPSMEILYQRYKDAGLAFLAVDMRESPGAVETFLKDNPYSFPILMDINGAVSAQYGVRAVPTTFIIDRDNQIIFFSAGARNWSDPAVLTAFESLLAYGQ
jgi:thiol-disulfide isomerase/thioredoxin